MRNYDELTWVEGDNPQVQQTDITTMFPESDIADLQVTLKKTDLTYLLIYRTRRFSAFAVHIFAMGPARNLTAAKFSEIVTDLKHHLKVMTKGLHK
jgi:hypothetical protein